MWLRLLWRRRLVEYLDRWRFACSPVFIFYLLGDLPARAIAFAPEMEAERIGTDVELAHLDVGEPIRECRPDVELAVGSVGAEPEDCLEHMKDAARCPGLRNIGSAGIEYGEVGPLAAPLETSEHFWEAVDLEAARGVEYAADDVVGLAVESIAFEASGDNAVVVRPN